MFANRKVNVRELAVATRNSTERIYFGRDSVAENIILALGTAHADSGQKKNDHERPSEACLTMLLRNRVVWRRLVMLMKSESTI